MPADRSPLDPLAVEEPAAEEPPEEKAPEWDSEKLSQIPFRVLRGHCGEVNSCHFCFGDRNIISSSHDGTVQLWDVARGVPVRVFGDVHEAPVSECSLTADNKRMLSSSYDKTVKCWDMETGKVLWSITHEGLVTSCNISSDGKLAVAALDVENAISVINMDTGNQITYLKDHHRSTVTRGCFDPENQRVCSVSSDRTIKLWDMVARATTVTIKKGHDHVISDCTFSLNGRQLCTASWDKTLKLWDINTGEFRSHGPRIFSNVHEGSVSSCSFSEDASLLVSGGCDRTIVVWNVDTACKKLTLKGHDNWVKDVDISRDKKWILSASKDSTLRLWNIERCEHIPAVIENTRTMGLKTIQCEKCGKPFSPVEWDDPDVFSRCVFCRLASPSSNVLPTLPVV